MSLDADFVEGVLEESEIVDELVLALGFPVDFGHGDFARVDHIYNLAVYGSWAQLLNFGEI